MAPLPAYLVFSQRTDTSVDAASWDAQCRRFFGATLTVSEEGRRLAVAPLGQAPVARAVLARPAAEQDYSLASDAEARMSRGGLGLLARRCPVVWEIARETLPDPDALRIAAVLASVLLGPILDPDHERGPDIFGVKTAREKLAAGAASQ